jgi:hypothetical protein
MLVDQSLLSLALCVELLDDLVGVDVRVREFLL